MSKTCVAPYLNLENHRPVITYCIAPIGAYAQASETFAYDALFTAFILGIDISRYSDCLSAKREMKILSCILINIKSFTMLDFISGASSLLFNTVLLTGIPCMSGYEDATRNLKPGTPTSPMNLIKPSLKYYCSKEVKKYEKCDSPSYVTCEELDFIGIPVIVGTIMFFANFFTTAVTRGLITPVIGKFNLFGCYTLTFLDGNPDIEPRTEIICPKSSVAVQTMILMAITDISLSGSVNRWVSTKFICTPTCTFECQEDQQSIGELNCDNSFSYDRLLGVDPLN